MKRVSLLILVMIMTLISGCIFSSILAVRIIPSSSSALIGTELELSAVSINQNGNRKPLARGKWRVTQGPGELSSTSGEKVMIRSSKPGTSEVTLTYGDHEASIKIDFTYIPQITSLIVEPKKASILEGQQLKLTAYGIDQYGKRMDVVASWNYIGSGAKIIIISKEDVMFEPKLKGNYMVVASVGNINGSAEVFVGYIPVAARVEINPVNQKEIRRGDSIKLRASVYDQYGEKMSHDLLWSTRGASCRIIGEDREKGELELKVVSYGETRISVEAGKVRGSIDLKSEMSGIGFLDNIFGKLFLLFVD